MAKTRYWYKGGKSTGTTKRDANRVLHRLDDLPAIEYANGSKEWFIDGLSDRADGPTFEGANGYKSWRVKDLLHRLGAPAGQGDDGAELWMVNGQYHRVDGPAIFYPETIKRWMVNGKLHRIDGPAIEYLNKQESDEYYIEGKEYETKEEFERMAKLKAFL